MRLQRGILLPDWANCLNSFFRRMQWLLHRIVNPVQSVTCAVPTTLSPPRLSALTRPPERFIFVTA